MFFFGGGTFNEGQIMDTDKQNKSEQLRISRKI